MKRFLIDVEEIPADDDSSVEGDPLELKSNCSGRPTRLTKVLLIRLTPEEHAAIGELAQREQRSMAAQIRYVLQKQLELHPPANAG